MMPKKYKVGFLSNKPPVFNGGFSQRIKREIDLVQRLGFTVFLFSFFSYSSKKEIRNGVKLKLSQEYPNILCESAFLLSSRFNIFKLYNSYYVSKVVKWIKKNKIDVLICENLWCAFIGSIACKQCNIKAVFDYHGVVPEESVYEGICKTGDRVNRYLKRIERYALFNCNYIICVSQHFKNYLMTSFGISGCNIFVVPCCVDYQKTIFNLNKRYKIRNALGVENKKVLIYAGSITKYQCVDEMVFLFSELQKNYGNYFLIFLSAYNNYSTIDTKLKESGLKSVDYCIRSVPHQDVFDYYCASDFGLVIREDHLLNRVASPTKIAEYLSAGLPIIGTNSIGDIDSINTEIILFSYSDLLKFPLPICEKINNVDISIENRLENFNNGNKYIDLNLSWDSYIDVYRTIIVGSDK